MGKRKPKQTQFGGTSSPAEPPNLNTGFGGWGSSAASGADTVSIPLDRPLPRQRGRPRKNPMGCSLAERREDSVNNTNAIVKVLLRCLKEKNKPMATANNGFARGLKPDTIVAGFLHEGQLMLALKFKNRKLPELITSMELKLRAPSLLIQYYVSNLHYPHDDDDDDD